MKIWRVRAAVAREKRRGRNENVSERERAKEEREVMYACGGYEVKRGGKECRKWIWTSREVDEGMW